MKENKKRLCYVDLEGHRLYFTDNFEGQWGDDWGDRPYWCNAGPPYYCLGEGEDSGGGDLMVIFADGHGLYEPKLTVKEELSVQDINEEGVPWLQDLRGRNTIKPGAFLEDVIAKIEEIGGVVYFPQGF